MERPGDSAAASDEPMMTAATDDAALRKLGELIPAICWIADERGHTQWMNAEGHAFYGDHALSTEVDDLLVHPDDFGPVVADWQAAHCEGTPIRHTVRTRGRDGRYRPLLCRAQPIRDTGGAITGWFCMQTDLSGDSIRQRHEAFLRNLSEATRGMIVTRDILEVTSQMLGRHLGIARVAYSEALPGEYGSYRVEADWTDGSTGSFTGEWRMASAFPTLVEYFATGKTLVTSDAYMHPLIGPEIAARLEAGGIRAAICAPLIKDGVEVAGLLVHQLTPRDFSTDEVRLVEDVAERTWATLTRARAEANLQEREKHQTFLLDWSDRIRSETSPERLLTATLEMLGRHIGVARVTYTEGNAAGDLFTIVAEWRDEVMSIAGAVFDVNNVGSAVEREWLAGELVHYDDIANDTRIEDWAAENFAYCEIGAMVSTPLLHDGKVRHVLSVQHRTARAWRPSEVALIRDLAERLWVMLDRSRAHQMLMERERMQAMLLRWSDSIRNENTPRAILKRTLSAIGEHMGVSRVNYAEADAVGEALLIVDDWVDGVQSLAGGRIPIAALGDKVVAEHLHGVPFRASDCHDDDRFDETVIALYDSVDVRAVATVPLVRNGKLVAVLSIQQNETRVWSDAEVELLADMAERTWAIIERARSEEQLAESEALLAGYFENAPIAMYLKDEAGRYLRLNQEMANVLGVPIEKALGRTGYDFIEPSAADQVYQLDRKALSDGTQSSEIQLSGRDDLTSILSIRFPITAGEGTVTRLGGFTLNLTEQKRAEAALERSRDALFQSEKLNALGSLLAGVSHELNNPLSIVVAQAVMMERQAQGSELAERAVKIRKAADRCARIVQTFLGMARQRQPERTATDLVAVAAAALELTAYGLKTDGVVIVRDFACTLPSISADADQLHQVIINLIVNAQQAMADADTPERRLTLRSAAGAAPNTVTLDVIDTGPGVPASARRRIFEPFFTTKPQGQGTGIGLSFSRGLAEAHGGLLELIDSVGGAHFRLTLPVYDGVVLDCRVPSVAVDAAPLARRALVVDDEREIAEALADFLSLEGFTCEIAEGGAAAQARLIDGDFDLIVSDLRMPDVDGPELYAWLLSHRPDLARRTAFATGDTLGHAAARFLAEARRPVVEKPFMPEAVQRLLLQMELP